MRSLAVSPALARSAAGGFLVLILASGPALAVQFTGVQSGPGEWTYTLTYDPLDNFSVCQPQTTITLSGLSGVTSAFRPTSNDFPFPLSEDVYWTPQVLGGGTTVTWTHIGPGTGNFDIPKHVFGFRVVAPSITSGQVALATDGFSKDLGPGGHCPGMERDIQGTTLGPSALACPGASVSAPLSFAAGRDPLFVAAGDFDGDGRPDLAVANAGSADVSVLLGNGDGTFRPQIRSSVGRGPRSLAVGDFDADGHLDLAVANARSGDVSILLGRGDGTFRPQVRYPSSGTPRALFAGDFDLDGNLDLAVAKAKSAGVSILLGNGAGRFRRGGRANVRPIPEAAATADWNGDGTLDLAVARSASDEVALLLGAAPCNRPPVARCADVTLPAGSTCRAAVGASAFDAGSSDPEGQPLTLSLVPAGPFGLGPHPVTLVATDREGGVASCQAKVTVVDTTPPRVAASLTEIRRLSRNSRVFRVSAIASDNCGVARKTGRMLLPTPEEARAFPVTFIRLVNGVTSVGINYRNERTTLIGPSGSGMRALLATILNDGGAAVTDRQEVTLINGTNYPREQSLFAILDNPSTAKIDGPLRSVNALLLELRVDAFDAAGNHGAAGAVPSFE